MKTYFMDTNLFIRYLTNDDIDKADRVEQLLNEAAAKKIKLITAEMVIAEIVWVLESNYRLGKKQIAQMLEAIFLTPGLEIINGKLVEKAVQIYASKNIDFVDAYIVTLMDKLGISGIYSFDKKHLGRIKTINRMIP